MLTLNSTRPTQDLSSRLDALLHGAVERRHVRHGLMAVAQVDGEWSWEGAHGVADLAGILSTPDLRYPIASITKLFTATVVLRLVEQQKLALDDRIVDLLPADVTTGLHVVDDVDRTG